MARDIFGNYPTRLDCVCNARGISLIHHQADPRRASQRANSECCQIGRSSG
jgi:hypothetical protein